MSLTPSALECNSGAFDGSVETLSCDGTGSIEALSCRNTGVASDPWSGFPYDPPRLIRLFGHVGAGLTGSFGGTPHTDQGGGNTGNNHAGGSISGISGTGIGGTRAI